MSEKPSEVKMLEEIKTSHALRVLSRATRMKDNEFICDFTIKVGGKSFPAHRTVLAASSDYFEALFSSKMKEVVQGFVEMKGLGVKGVQHSLEFMYTGSSQITLEYVDEILHAADMFQLDDLKKVCFLYLTKNLSPNNCLVVASLARKYDHHDLAKGSEQVIVANFNLVISCDLFPSIARSDLLSYISQVDHQTSWQAAVTWAKEKDEFPKLVEAMDIQKFPFEFLWKTVLEEPLVKESKSIKNKVIKRLFSDPEDLKNNLVIENCVLFKFLATEHKIAGITVNVITQFMEDNFEDLASQPNVNNLSKDDLLFILGSPSTKCSSEEVKWKAGLAWVKHDLRQRKKAFLEIFSLIKLQRLSSAFLRDQVRSEALVEESRKCSNILMDVLLAKSAEMEAKLAEDTRNKTAGTLEADSSSDSSKDDSELELGAMSLPTVMDVPDTSKETGSTDSSDPAIVEGDQPPGKMSRKTLYSPLPGYESWEGWKTTEIKYSFPKGSLHGVHYESREFKAYLPYADWLYYNVAGGLEEAFKQGQVFKLHYKAGDRTGEIVWGDIPHKTNKTGGPKNNGYPDEDYIDRLIAVLRKKGFLKRR